MNAVEKLVKAIEKIIKEERKDVQQVQKHPFGTIETIKLRILEKVDDFGKQQRTTIKILNDTDEELTVRQASPSVFRVKPQKMCVVFVRGDEVFFKIWNGNVVMFADGRDLVLGKEKQKIVKSLPELGTQVPQHMHILSNVYWAMVDGLVKNNFPEEQANIIVATFFKDFEPLPKDRMRI